MKRLLRIEDAAALNAWPVRPGLPAFEAGNLRRHAPDSHWVLLDEEGMIAGRCSLWWKSVPHHPGHRLGLVGHYATDTAEAAQLLLNQACEELKANRCTLAVGPMDGNTWRHYRFVTESNGAPPFFLEPAQPPDWPRQFTRHGFEPLATYFSAVDERLEQETDEQAGRAAARVDRLGVALRPIRMDRFETELRAIHAVVTASFQGGFLYQPLSEAEFVAEYLPIRPYVRPELVLLAEHGGRVVGFVFAVPDVLQARAGQSIDTAIIKTLAILPERALAGLGSHLVATTRRSARALGFRRLIHALMHESSKSRGISARYATLFRRYTLFAQAL